MCLSVLECLIFSTSTLILCKYLTYNSSHRHLHQFIVTLKVKLKSYNFQSKELTSNFQFHREFSRTVLLALMLNIYFELFRWGEGGGVPNLAQFGQIP